MFEHMNGLHSQTDKCYVNLNFKTKQFAKIVKITAKK